MKRSLLIITLLLMTGCSSITQEGKIPDEVINSTKVGVSAYCETFHNLHRIAMRLIHVVDPQWQSICVQYEKSKAVATQHD